MLRARRERLLAELNRLAQRFPAGILIYYLSHSKLKEIRKRLLYLSQSHSWEFHNWRSLFSTSLSSQEEENGGRFKIYIYENGIILRKEGTQHTMETTRGGQQRRWKKKKPAEINITISIHSKTQPVL